MPHITLMQHGWRCNTCGFVSDKPAGNYMEHHCPQPLPKAMDKQEGGNHYKNMAIQPVEFIHKNGLTFIAGNVIKYVCRYEMKNGIEDLKKARHYIDLLIEMEGK